MRIYLDTCCLMRPFDDQSFPRIRLETLVVSDLMEYIQAGRIQWIAGKILYEEVMACPAIERREKALEWLHGVTEWQPYSPVVAGLAKRLAVRGIDEWDARHIATAETAACDWFLTTDAALIKRSRKIRPKLSARIANPTEFILEDAL